MAAATGGDRRPTTTDSGGQWLRVVTTNSEWRSMTMDEQLANRKDKY